MQLKQNRFLRQAKGPISGLAMVLLLFSSALAASPSLHHFFHSDSDSPAHTCLVTMLAHGQVLSSEAGVAVALVVAAVLVLVVLETSVPLSERDLRLPAGRAPPLV
jgi:hypothetical protein